MTRIMNMKRLFSEVILMLATKKITLVACRAMRVQEYARSFFQSFRVEFLADGRQILLSLHIA